MVSVASSTGIWRAASEVSAALNAHGTPTEVAQRPAQARNHFHLGNSTRSLLPAMARRPGSVVTVHDAVPRNRWVRRLLARPQARILDRLHVVTHSRRAAAMLEEQGWRGTATIVPSLLPVSRPSDDEVGAWRTRWTSDEFELTLVTAGEIRASKGTVEIIDAARRHPGIRLVLLGTVTDPSMRSFVDAAPRNVIHCEARSDEAFCAAIAAGDALLSLRRASVGETSGPVVQAHRLGRPVVGLAAGTLEESCGPGDLLLPEDASADDLFDAALTAGLHPLDPESPQIPDPAAISRQLTTLYREIGW